MKIRFIPIILAAVACLASCSSPKTSLPYFVDIREVKEGVLDTLDYLPTIKPDDELSITVNSTNPGATAVYQLSLIHI